MNFDQQLVIGIVFIVAGIAVALLAYAAYLNREAPPEEDELEEAPTSREGAGAGDVDIEPEQDAIPNEVQTEADAGHDQTQEEAEGEATSSAEAAHRPASMPEPEIKEREEKPPERPAAEGGIAVTSARESDEQSAPAVQLYRNQETGRINVDIDGRIYNSIEELRASHDWKRVDHLFSDILAWLVKEQPAVEEAETHEEQPEQDRPLSMVDQINEILVEKLDARESGPRAVRLMEGTGGNIRVYIGMDSYPMDEVPDEEVQAIIRQAVREWESRQ
ncbi:MAG: hypothetical protein R3191_07420 [Anaerolineales bacterium]|nr:hypothetical protein [Anaerolineales bacterium]